MELDALSDQAMELRRRFAEAAQRQGRREWTADEVMQGFLVDVGDLMRLLMAKRGLRTAADVDRRLGHELADCLWSVLVLARLHGVDLGAEFQRMVNEVSASLAEPGTGATAQP